jgi:MFS superfamily sulfate permease-like transporter
MAQKLFALTTDTWQGAPMLYFVGAVALGVMYPLGIWAIAKRYPETERFAWWSLLAMALLAALAVLLEVSTH